jgi:hypothetical protein
MTTNESNVKTDNKNAFTLFRFVNYKHTEQWTWRHYIKKKNWTRHYIKI